MVGDGGPGGGGRGGTGSTGYPSPRTVGDGLVNTGSGGGGTTQPLGVIPALGGNGGPGIVIVKYLYP
jgi:hypothetical protein